ncbi:uncharacterized protein [Lolium perenne]|uniref:uncharacterized protein n=1 Tax=Lolium perenne TaxID=4522 RepID=UPI003A992146
MLHERRGLSELCGDAPMLARGEKNDVFLPHFVSTTSTYETRSPSFFLGALFHNVGGRMHFVYISGALAGLLTNDLEVFCSQYLHDRERNWLFLIPKCAIVDPRSLSWLVFTVFCSCVAHHRNQRAVAQAIRGWASVGRCSRLDMR